MIQVQNLSLGFVGLHEVLLDPQLKPAYASLDGILSPRHVDCIA